MPKTRLYLKRGQDYLRLSREYKEKLRILLGADFGNLEELAASAQKAGLTGETFNIPKRAEVSAPIEAFGNPFYHVHDLRKVWPVYYSNKEVRLEIATIHMRALLNHN